ncbi:hypothetical protein A1O3_09673 [Capronia epimyces CBS 606.96]|uniref:Uncharacterized protein n=1 Tax=Capronia epimyces CBS 606.96 TaxID=1182542 RepID=W9XAE9_9EURO|nr:uncharacterized protein A1O3_09673 [Capronia epimyces CBS 606.96]EXJ77447.1 hypothetical protein A1O3_09673 [Capronia epimyces CBS 606.96]
MQTLFPFAAASPAPTPKLHVTSGLLPPYVSASQAPTRKSPWRTVRDVGFIRSATVALPDELCHIIWQSVEAAVRKVRYVKVIMKLEDVLDGEFFTEYIKRGNVLMLSEGEPGVDNVFSLKDGILRLNLAKEVYERTGLPGTPVRSGGRKHVKSSYVVEYNLRLPSMLHGKKGFERLVWAAKNVLNSSLQWLFLDLNDDHAADVKGPIITHHPTIMHDVAPTVKKIPNALIPSTLTTTTNIMTPSTLTERTRSHPPPPTATSSSVPPEELQETMLDLFEYVDMLSLASPRVQATDHVDPFISRYQVPDVSGRGYTSNETRAQQPVTVMTWTGLISAQWVLDLLCAIIKQSRTARLPAPEQAPWLALTVSAHRTQAVGQVDGYTVILQPDGDDGERGDGPNSDHNHRVDENQNDEPQTRSVLDQHNRPTKRPRLVAATTGDEDDDSATGPKRANASSEYSDLDPLKSDSGATGGGTTTATTTTATATTTTAATTTTTTATGTNAAARAGFHHYICAEYVDSLVQVLRGGGA